MRIGPSPRPLSSECGGEGDLPCARGATIPAPHAKKSAAPFVYLGKVSYGVYLYHLMAPFVLHKTFFPHLVDGTETGSLASGAAFVLKCLVAVLLASISWFLLERPLNNLKRSFPFQPPHASPAPGDAD